MDSDPNFSSEWTLGGKPCIVADPAVYPLAAFKANSFRFVVGPAHGSGYVLLLRSDLQQPALKKGGPLELKIKAGGKTLKVKKVWILSAFRANPGGSQDDRNAVYLVKLVDWRYFLNRWSTSTRSINVRNWSGGDPDRFYVRETVKALRTPYSWNEVLKMLWGDVSGLGAYRNVNQIRSATPEDLHNMGGNAWRFLNEVAARAGRVINYKPEQDEYSIRKLAIDATPLDLDVKNDLEFDARPLSPDAVVAPAIIRVYFARRLEDYGTEPDTAANLNWATSFAGDWLDVPTKVPGAIGGTIQPVWASTPAIVKHRTSATYLNLADMKSTAQEIADGWLMANGAEALSRAHVLLKGIQKQWLPNESIREMTIRDLGDGLLSEVRKYPGMPETLPDFLEPMPGDDCGDENFAPLDTARRTLPNYPRLANIIEVFDYQQGAGKMLQANSSGVHPGYVRRIVAGQLERLEKCWILFVDDYSTKRGSVPAKNGDFFGPGRLSGLHEYGGERLPLYVVRSSAAGSSIAQFRLTSSLSVGGSAEAVKITYNPATGAYDAGEAIRVVDWYSTARGMWQAPAAPGGGGVVEGLAQLRATRSDASPGTLPEYEIIWMETLAWEVEGTLDFDLSTASPTEGVRATVTAAFEQGKHPGTKIQVHDDQNFFPRALKGAKFKATRSEHEGVQGYYKITQCQQCCFRATAMLVSPMCGDDASITPSTFQAMDASPFNQIPLAENIPETIANPRAHRGRDGDEVVIEWHHTRNRWEVTGVTKHARVVLIAIRYEDLKLEVKTKTIAAEDCDGTDPSWSTVFEASPCIPEE